MPVETIGVGTPGAQLEWLQAQGTLAIRHLQKICGDPPLEMELEIVWEGHELGEYPTIALTWEDGMRGAPWQYIARCQAALTAYEDGEEPPRWSEPCGFDGDLQEDTDWDNPKLPEEPSPDASLAELHNYVCKLTDYSARVSSHASPGPRLVENDDEETPSAP